VISVAFSPCDFKIKPDNRAVALTQDGSFFHSTLQIWDAIEGKSPSCIIELNNRFQQLSLQEDSLVACNPETVLFLQLCVNPKPIKVVTISPSNKKEVSIMPHEIMKFAMSELQVSASAKICSDVLVDTKIFKVFVLFSTLKESGSHNQDLQKKLQSLPRSNVLKTKMNHFQGYQIFLDHTSFVESFIESRAIPPEKIPYGTAVLFAQEWDHRKWVMVDLHLNKLIDIWNQ